MDLFLNNSTDRICVVGLGYVGLPLLCEFAKHFSVIGFDISESKIANLIQGIDVTKEVDPEALRSEAIQFTSDPALLREASVIIVTVPTPIDGNKKPDLSPVISACHTIGRYMKRGCVVVFESTVYPGVTEDICLPILESESGLVYNTDFFLGYSPERLSPGDKGHSLTKVVKVVAGSTPDVASRLSALYGKIVSAGIHQAPSIKVAEAAKVIENTQRDLNVALMNELSIIFNKLSINTHDVIEAASTKWNFMKMSPGLVGGHCIGVDPYYLTYKAEEVGYHPEVILSGRRINDGMGKYVAQQTVKQLIKAKKQVLDSTVLVYGITFKENVPDIRNSKVMDVITELREFGVNVLVTDCHADSQDTMHEYGLSLSAATVSHPVDCVLLAVPHAEYLQKSVSDFFPKNQRSDGPNILVDIKGVFRRFEMPNPTDSYWCL